MESEVLQKLRERLSEEARINRLEVFDFDGTLIV